MVVAKKFVVKSPFEGVPKKIDFEIVEEELPALNNHEFLAEAAYFSVDPYQRMKLGDHFPCDMIGGQIAKYLPPTSMPTIFMSKKELIEIVRCKVIGLAGTKEKCDWLVNELGFDAAGNYKTVDIAKFLKENAPKGIDCYFDNVGGEISSTVLSQMNPFGRVAVCGAISSYNETDPEKRKATTLQPYIVAKQLKIEGFLVNRFAERSQEGITRNLNWIREGRLKYREHITSGFENAADAFIGLFTGENTGKTLVKIS